MQPLACFAYTQIDTNNYWQCKSYDNANLTWTASNTYQKTAMNTALDSCKKGSKNPASCKIAENLCVEFNQDRNHKPRWQCTSLDGNGTSYTSNYFATKDDAAINSLDSCKKQSAIPDTCLINLVSCSVIVDGEVQQ